MLIRNSKWFHVGSKQPPPPLPSDQSTMDLWVKVVDVRATPLLTPDQARQAPNFKTLEDAHPCTHTLNAYVIKCVTAAGERGCTYLVNDKVRRAFIDGIVRTLDLFVQKCHGTVHSRQRIAVKHMLPSDAFIAFMLCADRQIAKAAVMGELPDRVEIAEEFWPIWFSVYIGVICWVLTGCVPPKQLEEKEDIPGIETSYDQSITVAKEAELATYLPLSEPLGPVANANATEEAPASATATSTP